ncbi:hypothetical protein D6D03_08854 [Aureobasidium pullulans]|nr:hypothetical protein D6D03_08854 [Aureobasidium pullulans]
MPLSGELALGDIGVWEVSFPMAEPQMIPSNAVPTTSYQTPAAEFTTPSPPQRRSSADTQRYYPSIAPNPAGLVSKRRQEQEDEEAMLRSNSKHRKRTPLLEHLNDEERLLITLKEDEALPWKEIAARFSDQSGQSITVATLQMRYLLLRQRLRNWEERDLEALRQMEIGGKGNRGRKSTKNATSRSRTASPSTMRFNARSHAEERDQDPTHGHHHMLSLEETPRVDARNIRPEASASRQTISHSDKEAYFVLFAAELQKLITVIPFNKDTIIPSTRISVLRPNGLEVTAALGLSGGPVQGILQATRTYEHQVTRQRFTRPDSYDRALDHLSQAVALVYDCKTHIAWLVPQTSLLLHLCHAYYARLSNIKGQPDPIPWAKPSTDGASAATAAFRGSGDIVVSDAGDHDQLLLRQLLVSLSSSLQVTQDTRQLPKKIFRWTKEVYFSELQDQILEPDNGSALRVLDPAEWPSIKAWLEIATKVDGLLVCRNLDQAIALVGRSCSPHNQSPQANTNIITNNMNSNNTTTTTTTTTQTQLSTHLATCSSCAKVPEGRGYLVAHAWCLQNVLKRPSLIAGRDMATWIQNGKPFDVHLHAPNESIWTHPEKVLQSFAKSERASVCNKTGGHTIEGAVVFGKYGEESLGEWLRKVALSP